MSRKLITVLTACALAFSATAASAAEFNEERANIWVARTQSFINSVSGDDLTLQNLSPRLSAACVGITMEVSKPNVPTWAQQGHLYFCHAADDIKHLYGKAICKDLKFSLKALQKADPAKETAAVMAAANDLIFLENTMLEGFGKSKVCR